MRRRFLTLSLALVALALAPVPAGAGKASTPEGTIKGPVIDRTCYGPCFYPPERRLFTGDALVEAFHLPDRKLYGSTEVKDGRYRLMVPPGAYRVRVTPYPKSASPVRCWEGSSRRANVVAGEVTRVRLTVENVCVQ